MHSSLLALLAASAITPTILAHTWVEQIRVISGNGTYVGEYGYPRSFKPKTAPGFNDQADVVFLQPDSSVQPPFIREDSPLCHPKQRKQVQSEKFPRAQTPAGSWLALRYTENGHVSNPGSANSAPFPGRRKNGGTVFVFGTTQPKEDEKIASVLRWTEDGQGGDKRGVLLGVNDYDDGRCYELNGEALTAQRSKKIPNFAFGQATGGQGTYPLLCETNVQLPKTASTGQPYTLYWVWQWPMEPNPKNGDVGKDEYYTTCMDVDIVDTLKKDAAMKFPNGGQQDAMSVAVSNFSARKAAITNPIEGEIGPVFKTSSGSVPTPTGGAPPASKPTLLPSGPPFGNSTASLPIPTLTRRPGENPGRRTSTRPTQQPSSIANGDNNGIIVTVTQRITITAVPSQATPRAVPRQVSEVRLLGRMYRG
ncbi:hypothetical protein B0J11DRAFT_52013 [Dendryphion nanum]|uniref:DUF7492 domain-containing protein n=1 Tax=Dendryphion nanum TaxID=256645 RepID=A0A9P9IGB5_9PLEO|nr:hypothetical protein B0J11DRAFT_52013 [Dendryphion nanum]